MWRHEVGKARSPGSPSIAPTYEISRSADLTRRTQKPFDRRPAPDRKALAEHPRCERLAEVDALRGEEPSWNRRTADAAQKVAPRYAVGVEEDEVVACCRESGGVESSCFPEPFVRLPDMPNVQLRLPVLHDLGDRLARTVVGNDDFELVVGWGSCSESARSVVSRKAGSS